MVITELVALQIASFGTWLNSLFYAKG